MLTVFLDSTSINSVYNEKRKFTEDLLTRDPTLFKIYRTTCEVDQEKFKAITPVPKIEGRIFNQDALEMMYQNLSFRPKNSCHAPKQMTLMLVDVIFPGWVPFPYLGLAQYVAWFIKAHDIALNNYNYDTFIGGHLTRLGTRNDVVVAREFVSDLEKAAAQANKQVPFPENAKQVGAAQAFPSTKTYTEALDQRCTQIMLPKWENRLGGAQQFMSSHCYTMAEALRIEPTVALTQNSTS